MKKIFTLSLAIMLTVVMFNACKPEPEPEPTEQNETPEENIKKKYLVSYHIGEKEDIYFQIYWNEDYTRIDSICHKPGHLHHSTLYNFTYYGNDSIVVTIDNISPYPIELGSVDAFICHLDKESKITKVDYYFDYPPEKSSQIEKKFTRNYKYDEQGRLISTGLEEFTWDGDNVVKYTLMGKLELDSSDFGTGIHPMSMMPYFLTAEISTSYFLTAPLWKNDIVYNNILRNEYDEDGYVTKTYRANEDSVYKLYKSYYYETYDKE